LGLTKEAFADAANIDRTYGSEIERAIANSLLYILSRISSILSIGI
jgi:transcriptional regulator with XRE-family HTH domain